MKNQDDLIFALDIGTRTVIGLIMEYTGSACEIIASEVVEHENRAMLDGQIHNVMEVTKQVQRIKDRLEEKLDLKLKKVAIAAAGRALKTVTQNYSLEFQNKKLITTEDVQTLEFAAVQEAQERLASENPGDNPGDYHFVGYSVIEYQLDGIFLGNLVGQKGKTIQVELIATFLPRIVVDSLLTVIEQVDLEVEHLTLEPIAASNVVIPKEMYNFNLALVDIGAGTSDIAITRGGSMVGYAMVPVAGDEITEALAEYYLLDYHSSEKLKRSLRSEETITVKDILGQEIKVDKHEALKAIQPQVTKLAGLISNEILALNKKSPQAVICIGGGSLTPLLTEELAKQLDLPSNRVGVRDSEDIKNVTGSIDGVNSTQAITPIGIALTSHQNQHKANFLEVGINDQTIQLFTLNQPTVSDALLAAEINIKKLHGRPGLGLTCTVNGKLKTLKGTMGQPGHIFLNGEEVELGFPVSSGDKINFKSGLDGKDATGTIADVVPVRKTTTITVNGTQVELKPRIYQNGQLVDYQTPLMDRAEIIYTELMTIRDGVAQVLEVSPETLNNKVINFTFNGKKRQLSQGDFLVKEDEQLAELDRPLEDGTSLTVTRTSSRDLTIAQVSGEKGTAGITFTFNGSELTMPVDWDIRCNGKIVDFNYEIKDGDEIICQPQPVTFNQVLNYINYKLPVSLEGELELTINGKPANFTDRIGNGDMVQINLKAKKGVT